MSTQTAPAPAPAPAAAPARTRMSPSELAREFTKGLWAEIPPFRLVLGLCPALAVTNTVENSLAMGVATFFVLFGSSLLVSLLKSFIPKEVRISAYILVIATFVTIADMGLEALVPEAEAVDLRVATFSLFGMMNWIYTWYRPEKDMPLDRLAGQMLHIFLEGLRSPVHSREAVSSDEEAPTSIWRNA